jgi:hypothetical protein
LFSQGAELNAPFLAYLRATCVPCRAVDAEDVEPVPESGINSGFFAYKGGKVRRVFVPVEQRE